MDYSILEKAKLIQKKNHGNSKERRTKRAKRLSTGSYKGLPFYSDNGTPLFGQTAENAWESESQRDYNLEKKILKWIEKVSLTAVLDKNDQEYDPHTFEVLKNGVILCRIMNRIRPNIIRNVNKNDYLVAYRENINLYLGAVKELNLPVQCYFPPCNSVTSVNLLEISNSLGSLALWCDENLLELDVDFPHFKKTKNSNSNNDDSDGLNKKASTSSKKPNLNTLRSNRQYSEKPMLRKAQEKNQKTKIIGILMYIILGIGISILAGKIFLTQRQIRLLSSRTRIYGQTINTGLFNLVADLKSEMRSIYAGMEILGNTVFFDLEFGLNILGDYLVAILNFVLSYVRPVGWFVIEVVVKVLGFIFYGRERLEKGLHSVFNSTEVIYL